MKIGLYADGGYQGRCKHCNQLFVGDKRAIHCLRCAAEICQSQLAEAKKQLLDYEQTEAAICPEDVGIVEYVKSIKSQLATAGKAIDFLNKENKELKEQLTAEQEKNRWIPVGQEPPSAVNGWINLLDYKEWDIITLYWRGTDEDSDVFFNNGYTHWRPITLPQALSQNDKAQAERNE